VGWKIDRSIGCLCGKPHELAEVGLADDANGLALLNERYFLVQKSVPWNWFDLTQKR
jgi:hypothetical protein